MSNFALHDRYRFSSAMMICNIVAFIHLVIQLFASSLGGCFLALQDPETPFFSTYAMHTQNPKPVRPHTAIESSSALSPVNSVPWLTVLRRAHRLSSTTVSVAA